MTGFCIHGVEPSGCTEALMSQNFQERISENYAEPQMELPTPTCNTGILQVKITKIIKLTCPVICLMKDGKSQYF
jgi:hypothetical protein